MQREFDLLIVGAGFFGATCAYELTKKGFRCLVIDKRDHIGGNCFTDVKDGINIHRYGPHIFHTSNRAIWNWINQFAEFNHYRHKVKVSSHGRIYSFPLNLLTFHQLWGVSTPEDAKSYLDRLSVSGTNLEFFEGWLLSQVGREVYEKFFKDYSQKQWGQDPSTLPASIAKRIPIRLSFDDSYFDDPYQGIPIGGYTAIFSRLLDGIETRTKTDYFENRIYFDSLATKVLYTGPIDKFFDYKFGKLAYRSMQFEHSRLEIPDFQGVAQMNYASNDVPFTRIVEHKHFEFGNQPVTWITREFPNAAGLDREPMYPVKDKVNQKIFEDYRTLTEQEQFSKYYFGGRLAAYQYYDMHQIIGAALAKVESIKNDFLTIRETEELQVCH